MLQTHIVHYIVIIMQKQIYLRKVSIKFITVPIHYSTYNKFEMFQRRERSIRKTFSKIGENRLKEAMTNHQS